MVAQLGLHYRFPHLPGKIPVFNVMLALLPLVYVISALIFESIIFSKYMKSAESQHTQSRMVAIGSLASLPALVLPTLIIEVARSIPFLLPLPVGVSIFEPVWASTLLTLPLVIAYGILGATLGLAFGIFGTE